MNFIDGFRDSLKKYKNIVIEPLKLNDYYKCSNIWNMKAQPLAEKNVNALHLYRNFGFTEVLFDGEDEDGKYFKLMKRI